MMVNLSQETIERTLALIGCAIRFKEPLTRSCNISVRERACAEIDELRELYTIYDEFSYDNMCEVHHG